MNQLTYRFGQNYIHSSVLYSKENGYGFVTDQNRNQSPDLQIAELNSAFEPYYWLQNQNLISISDDETSCFIHYGNSTSDTWDRIPLIFKSNVPQKRQLSCHHHFFFSKRYQKRYDFHREKTLSFFIGCTKK